MDTGKLITLLFTTLCYLGGSLRGQERIDAKVMSQLTVPSTFFQIPIQELEDRISRLPDQAALDPLVRPAVEAAAKALQKTLDVKAGQAQAAVPFAINSEDVLLVRWRLPQPQHRLRTVGVWDTPSFTTFILECDPEPFASLSSSRDYLNDLIRWNEFSNLSVELLWNPSALNLRGFGTYVSAIRVGREFGILGKPTRSGYILLILFGKRLLSDLYPKELTYVPERFPPLRVRLQRFTREQLFAALDREANVENQYELLDNRDYILITELLRRGLADEEYSRILLPAKLHHHLLTSRLERVLRATVEAGQLRRYSRVIEQALWTLSAKPNDAESLRLVQIIFQELREYREADLGNVACRFLSIPQFLSTTLHYFMVWGHTEAHYACVERAEVPPSLHGTKEQARRDIEARLKK